MTEASSPKTSPSDRGRARASLSDRVYHLLFSRISNGRYAANEKLPTEHALAEEFGVSRPVLREALDRLRADGLIHSRQGAGSFVRSRPAPAPVGFTRVETIADIQRCYEFRLTIEPEAAFFAAMRRNDEILAELDTVLDLLGKATGNLTHREDADFAFHLAVTRAANNHYFGDAMKALRDHINIAMKMHGQSLMNDPTVGLEKVFAEHVAIFTAIRDREPETARAAMRGHIEGSRDRLFEGRLLDLSL